MPSLFAWFSVQDPFDPACTFTTSPWFGPRTLAAVRLLFALWTTTVLIVDLAHQAATGSGDSYFSYFTHLSYVGLCAYFWASGVQTARFALRARAGHYTPTYPLQRWHRVLQFLHVWLFSTVITFPVIVTVVFWSLLSSPATLGSAWSRWTNISVHALNVALLGLEVSLTNMQPPPWAYVIPVFLTMASYLGVAYLTSATQHFYTYSFLDPHKEGALLAAYIIGIGVATVLVFALMRTAILLRARAVNSLVARGRLARRTAAHAEGSSPIVKDAPVVRRIKAGGRWSWKRESRAAEPVEMEKGPRGAETMSEWETVDAPAGAGGVHAV